MLAAMDNRQKRFYPPSSISGPVGQEQSEMFSKAKFKTNRLRRSISSQKQQSVESPKYVNLQNKNGMSPPPEFKTPTRMQRSRSCGESPHNDSDFQQDIVWDATSPSPVRPGKRGKSAAIGISEIVRRIAPKHGRPQVTEPTLQQWIGDSAGIPCTPEVQYSKAKKKSPRTNGVDNLLKLAKQFDYNMFQQDEEEVDDIHQQSLELLSEDILEYENVFQGEPLNLLDGPTAPAIETDNKHSSQACVVQDLNMEDDLDVLFDEPTQNVSGNLSQMSLVRCMETSSIVSKMVPDKCSGPTPAVSTQAKGGPVDDNLDDDDWGNDDFLNDSLVIEMTQNPQGFALPMHCSTQRESREIPYDKETPIAAPTIRDIPGKQEGHGVTRNQKNRTTFKLEANPKSPLTTDATDVLSKHVSASDFGARAVRSAQQSGTSSRKIPISGSQTVRQTQHSNNGVPNKPSDCFLHRTSLANSRTKNNLYAITSTSITSHSTKENHPARPHPIESTVNIKPPVPLNRNDLLDEDLDTLFSSEPIWDDQGDDDLLCQMCEDLESQGQIIERPALKQQLTLNQTPGQRNHSPTPLAALMKDFDKRNTHTEVNVSGHAWTSARTAPASGFADCQPSHPGNITPASLVVDPARPSVNCFVGNASSNSNAMEKESFRYGPTRNGYGISNLGNSQQSVVQSTGVHPLKNTARDGSQFTFKKPPNPGVKVIITGSEKCSAVEIEHKKRQALERRRQRLQAMQNLRT